MSRQAATPGCYIVGSMKNNNENQANGGEAKAKPEMIKLGLDLHARQVTECRQLDGSTPKPAQKWDPWTLLGQIESWVQAGIRVYSCYEAGACGYWYHRELTRVGALNFVVVPRPLEDQRTRHQKTDRLDARALLNRLEKYLGGNGHAMSLVAVPCVQEEQKRSLVRYREQLLRDRRRAEARGRAIALCQGIEVPVGWWRGARWQKFSQQLPEWMSLQVRHWKEQAAALDCQERKIRHELQKSLEIELPIGVGRLSWVILERELRGWDRFHNRRQIASYTGLCPGIHRSNGRGREGSINRCGNSVVRYTLIEMAWRMLRWQPDYWPLQKLREPLISRRAKRRLVVAVARRLAIDLWRWATKRATAQELGLRLTLDKDPGLKG
jgi:transposase